MAHGIVLLHCFYFELFNDIKINKAIEEKNFSQEF